MTAAALPLERLAIHSITTKPWDLPTAVGAYTRRGVQAMSVWSEAIETLPATAARQILDDHGMRVPALVRGGFLTAESTAGRQERIDRNRGLLETAHTLGAEMIVLVVGASPGLPLPTQRGWVAEGIAALADEAEAAGVKLAIEPLHPMYAAERSCINRMTEAREVCEAIGHPGVGIAVDVYHVWWDPDLPREIELAGAQGRLFGFHLCDWRVPTRDLLNDRALMGDGCIDLRGIRRMVEAAGFAGWFEVEIFSDELWRQDQQRVLERVIERYQSVC